MEICNPTNRTFNSANHIFSLSPRYNYIEGTKLFIAYLNEVSQIKRTSVWCFMVWSHDLIKNIPAIEKCVLIFLLCLYLYFIRFWNLWHIYWSAPQVCLSIFALSHGYLAVSISFAGVYVHINLGSTASVYVCVSYSKSWTMQYYEYVFYFMRNTKCYFMNVNNTRDIYKYSFFSH